MKNSIFDKSLYHVHNFITYFSMEALFFSLQFTDRKKKGTGIQQHKGLKDALLHMEVLKIRFSNVDSSHF